MSEPQLSDAGAAALVLDALTLIANAAILSARNLTSGGAAIDDHQPVVERVAYAVTEIRAASELRPLLTEPAIVDRACCAIGELAQTARARLEPVLGALGIADGAWEAMWSAPVRAAARQLQRPALAEQIGRAAIEVGGKLAWPLDEILTEVRTSVRGFAERVVAPIAEKLHRHDELVPDSLIAEMASMGYFGLSVPEKYQGHELGNLAMILTTEELSRASLAGAGSLITRPEILAKALLAGGTEAQKQHWLPKLASGEVMVAISVTEPDTGSDVAAVACRAEAGTQDGIAGYFITGAKAWCTFAGRADVIALLARTDADSARGAKGLTLFVVEKPRFAGHEFHATQPGGGSIDGKADRTPGYRGMHSFTLAFERWFVPADRVVGGDAGVGRGFALQMAGFAAGRLQTGGRACGLAQAAVDKTIEYVAARRQFGKPIGDFGLTQYHLGRMLARLAAARAITYAAARAMDGDERAAAPLAAQAKLYACDMAVEIARDGQILHGGWGYAEEYAISRYVVDAQVLPIFEGVRPILALKVVGRALLGGT